MDFFDAVTKLANENPDVTPDHIRAALDIEVKFEEDRTASSTRSKAQRYANAIETAAERLGKWLKDGDTFAGTLNWRDVATQAINHSNSCMWAVCIAKARTAEAEAKAKAKAKGLSPAQHAQRKAAGKRSHARIGGRVTA